MTITTIIEVILRISKYLNLIWAKLVLKNFMGKQMDSLSSRVAYQYHRLL